MQLFAASWVTQFNLVPIPCDTPLMVEVEPPGLYTAIGPTPPPHMELAYIRQQVFVATPMSHFPPNHALTCLLIFVVFWCLSLFIGYNPLLPLFA